MSTNTTVPIDWDNQQDNALFGSLFPGGFRNQKNESNDLKSVFTNSPFGQYWDINIHEWAKPIFGAAKILDKKNIVIADKSSKISHNQADYYNAIIEDGISKYNFVVYSDSDGEKVLKWYNDKNNVPNENKPLEVLIFIETDDGKFDFGKIVRVKFGPAVLDDLKDKYFKELPWKDNDPEDIAEEFLKRAWATSVSSKTINAVEKEKNTSDFNDLLIKAIQYEYDNEKFDDFSWFIVMLKGTEFVGLNLPNWCFSTGQWFRDRKYIEDKFWNGDLPEKEYTPAFMPNSVFYDTKEDRSRAIKQMFNENYNYLIKKVNENITKENYISEKTKTFLLDKILECNEISSLFVDKFLSEINISDGWFQVYAKHYNAFIVGLHNGILEFIAGICDLTAIVILHCRQELGFRMTDMLSEKFENFLNDLLHNTLETLKKIWTKTIEIFKDFAKWYQQFSEYDGKSYKIIKEIAELIPDILTFVIPVLKGSKAAKLAKAGEEVAVLAEKQAAKETIEELTEAEAKIIAQTAKEALENGTATKATKEAVEKVENEIIEKTPTQLEEVVVKKKTSKKKIANVKEEAKIFKKTLDLSTVLSKYADEALTKWKDPFTRPGAVGVLEGEINGRVYQAVSYSSKGILKSKIVGRRHKLVQEWLTEIAEKGIRNRRNHGMCAEPVCISEFLFEAEKQLGMKANSMKLAQAKEILSKTKSKALRIDNLKEPLIQGLPKKACASCNPMLHYFKIKEIH